ncbi:hypothetical protein LSCM1_00208 [Leishmania martiniquensis]|uniref:Uncharacterized protein n=1 Tax=Leishmania martiniquensis TaxID=1580590 RepID=A0A836K5Q4_9TRYP|nr:hypothetical protein LSCM1_00208 [Leishmania martiniquensis]
MYPALPRWSDGGCGSGPVAPSIQRVARAAIPPSAQSRGAATNDRYVITPTVQHAAPPPVQATKTSPSGRLFVNHNAQLPAQSVTLAPVFSVAASIPGAEALPESSIHSHAGDLSQPIRSADRIGDHNGVIAAAFAEGHSAAAPPHPSVPSRPAHGFDRRGLARGSTVHALVDTPHDLKSPLPLAIEGVQTGEEVILDVKPARLRSSTNTTTSSSHDATQLLKLRRHLEKATADLQAMLNASRRQKQDHQQQRAEWLMILSECEARLCNVLFSQASRAQLIYDELCGAIKRNLGEMKAQVAKERVTEQEHANSKAEWDIERSALLRDLETVRAALASQLNTSSAAHAHKEEADKLRAELEALQRSTADQQRSLEERLIQVQSALQSTGSELKRCLQERGQHNYLVAQCRLFVRHVCQPGFSVVNGPSLEPVEKNRPEPTGFVLVPLVVLLHGYALLPESDRQALIDHYDAKAKSLKS